MKKLVIFDLDGTLLDTLDDITRAANYALKTMGFSVYSSEELKQFIGRGLKHLCVTALKENATEENIEKMTLLYREYYNGHKTDNAKTFDGFAETLQTLKDNGVTLAVATNKSDELAKSIVKHISGAGLFKYVRGSKNDLYKPDPGIIIDILNVCGFKKGDAVMVGDSEIDLLTAKNAGISSVFCNWGYGDKNCHTKADFYIDEPKDLIRIIRN